MPRGVCPLIYLVLLLLAARRRAVVTTNAPARPAIPSPRMASPSTTPLPSPPDCPPAVASAAEIGEVAADVTPLHRSLVALRVAAGAGAGAVRLLFARDGAGALELENTACVPWLVTPAVEPASRAATGGCPPEAGGLGCVCGPLDCGGGVAPLADPEAEAPVLGGAVLCAGAVGACGAGVEPAPALDGGALGGFADGAAGVPKPEGVQAQASPAPTTAIPNTDSTARPTMRALLCTGTPSSKVRHSYMTATQR